MLRIQSKNPRSFLSSREGLLEVVTLSPRHSGPKSGGRRTLPICCPFLFQKRQKSQKMGVFCASEMFFSRWTGGHQIFGYYLHNTHEAWGFFLLPIQCMTPAFLVPREKCFAHVKALETQIRKLVNSFSIVQIFPDIDAIDHE